MRFASGNFSLRSHQIRYPFPMSKVKKKISIYWKVTFKYNANFKTSKLIIQAWQKRDIFPLVSIVWIFRQMASQRDCYLTWLELQVSSLNTIFFKVIGIPKRVAQDFGVHEIILVLITTYRYVLHFKQLRVEFMEAVRFYFNKRLHYSWLPWLPFVQRHKIFFSAKVFCP